jgi:16S rRNA (uracil1498-N3)-methyltransferase
MITFFHDGDLSSGAAVFLSEDAAQHARVRRVQAGDGVRLVNGRGRAATGTLATVGKRGVAVEIQAAGDVARPLELTVIVPVADKERMLFAAEKCVEFQVTAWRPVYFARSRSVSPRGEGERFRQKVLARMRSALEQGGGAWLPELYDEAEAADAWGETPAARRLLLHHEGQSLAACVSSGPMAIAVGPEGGFERSEIEAAERSGWVRASLGAGTLRFETAVIAGAAVIRATQLNAR